MEFIPVDDGNRQLVNAFIIEHWFSTEMLIRGSVVDMTRVNGFAVCAGNRITGLITYTLEAGVCEITSLDSLNEKQGTGSALIQQVITAARTAGCSRVIVVTTNDNLNALRFYQKRGFDLARLYPNSLEAARRLKPSIPLIGENGIPLKHEIELELRL